MPKILNLEMMANPFNWAIIYLIVVFIGVAIRSVGNPAANVSTAA